MRIRKTGRRGLVPGLTMGKRGVPKVFRNNANVGTATAVITGRSNYTGTVTKTFNITKKLLTDTDVNISDLADHIYNGQPYQPRPEVKIGQRVLRENVDYTLSYAGDPANKGAVTVTVTGMGNYNGTVQRSYQITAKALQAQWLTVSPTTMTYTGSELKPLALVAHGEVRLIEGTDYDVTYANNTATGTATVKVTGKGNYTGEISGTFRIVSNVGGLSVTLSSSEADYTGEDQKPTLTVDSGYTFSGVSVDGKTVAVSTADAPTPLTKGENGVYTYVFTDVKEDHVILATFRKNGGSGSGSGGGTTLVVEPSQEEEPDTGVEKWLLLEPHDGYLKGRGNGLFCPNDSMTRAEAAMMFYRLLKEKDVPITVSFRDVPEDAWYSRAVGVMASIGLLKGVGGDCFDPNRPITRAEFAVLISRMATWEEVGQVRAYTDISSEDWFYGNVQLISYYGWMAGYPDGSFGPQRNISRGEAAKVINAMTRRRADKEAIDKEQGVRFDDVPESHWAFYEIMEAAISHGHQNVAEKEIWELK